MQQEKTRSEEETRKFNEEVRQFGITEALEREAIRNRGGGSGSGSSAFQVPLGTPEEFLELVDDAEYSGVAMEVVWGDFIRNTRDWNVDPNWALAQIERIYGRGLDTGGR